MIKKCKTPQKCLLNEKPRGSDVGKMLVLLYMGPKWAQHGQTPKH